MVETIRAGKVGRVSTRVQLRAFQAVRDAGVDDGVIADLEMLRHRDLDLSVKAGALLAFDALLLTAGFNPITASPGAPVSLDASQAPIEIALTVLGVILLAVSAFFALQAILVGEDFDVKGIEDDPAAIHRRMLAAHCAAIDKEAQLLALAGFWTLWGGLVTFVSLIASLAGKWF